MTQAYVLARGQSLGYKGEAAGSGLLSVSSPETSPLAYSLTYDSETRELLWWLEAFREGDGTITAGKRLRTPLLGVPGFESYTDSGHINVVALAAFKHGGQLKAQLLHFRGERPAGSGRNDNLRDQYTYRSGIYLVE